MSKSKQDVLAQNATDHLVATAKAGLSAVPLVGSLLSELAASLIPHQRTDRIVDFARKLESRLGDLDQDQLRNKLMDENFTDLVEESALQAVRGVTDERRGYVASLLAAGISDERISFVESRHLLRILGEVNDIEIVWLRFFLAPQIGADAEFRKNNRAVLEVVRAPIYPNAPPDQAASEKAALRANYLAHLVSLGLLDRRYKLRANGEPQFDKHANQFAFSYQISTLGRMLLKRIGLTASDGRPTEMPTP
ncbi:UNVERIFIED_ORG: hypothetical protein J2W38_006756 [Variovorax paradoxus]|nr:hypothetical protein [Variovorax paradoxus]